LPVAADGPALLTRGTVQTGCGGAVEFAEPADPIGVPARGRTQRRGDLVGVGVPQRKFQKLLENGFADVKQADRGHGLS
jgi:hypothetical protein